MPNSRRQRFSVHKRIADGDYCKVQTGLQTSDAETNPDIKRMVNKLIAMKSKNRMQPNSSKNTTTLQIIADCESTTSMLTEKKNSNTTNDKDVTVSSSNIDLFDALKITDDLPNESKETIENIEIPTKRARTLTRDNTPLRREKHLRQHRIKVRSPKRWAILGSQNKGQPNSNDINKCTIGTDPTCVVKEVEIYVDNSANVVETNEDKDRQSDYSLGDMSHICHDGDRLSPEFELLISACTYRGTVAGEHVKCPERRLTESGKSRWEQCGTRVSATDSDIKSIANKLVAMKSKNRMQPNCSNNTNTSQIIADCENTTSTLIEKKNSNTIDDKDVNASSSNANLIDIHNVTEDLETVEKIETRPKRARPLTRDNTSLRREKYLRQHRTNVRSPKRRAILGSENKYQPKSNNINNCTIGMDSTDWVKDVEIHVDNSANVIKTNENEDRQSDHSLDDMCRICHGGDSVSAELGLLLSACACRGTVGRVHVKCLERWLTESGKSRCELCGTRYSTRRVHRYGVPRALVMWILSQNAKQLMVDSLGIMLMSPLAVLAAWLSGRTLAGLMTQDSNGTPPWPLASTFVLACMTLVCYYCWIVSAATRHALGWWIWYRSQYEVRLTLENEE